MDGASRVLVLAMHSGRRAAAQALPGHAPSSELPWHVIAVLLSRAESLAPSLRGTEVALSLMQHVAPRASPSNVLWLTSGTQAAAIDASYAVSNAAHGGAWGLGRVARLEHAGVRVQCMDVRRELSVASPSLPVFLGTARSTSETELAWAGGTC